MEAEAVGDSLSSNEVEAGDSETLHDHEREAFGEPYFVPDQARHRKKASRKWCKRKEGRAHTYVFVKEYKIMFPKEVLCEYRCQVCGKTKVFWKKPEGRRDPLA